MPKILVVDDDPGARDALAEILGEEGYDVATAPDGRQALDYLSSGARPCVILLDLTMPVMDGWEFREHQIADPQLATLPVLVITATRDALPRSVTDDDVFRKPLDFSSLLARVERFCS